MKRTFAIALAVLSLSFAGLAAEKPASSDHKGLAAYYQTQATKFDAESKEHADMAKEFRANPHVSETKRPGASDTISHCEKLSADLHQAAEEARALAAAEQKLAQ